MAERMKHFGGVGNTVGADVPAEPLREGRRAIGPGSSLRKQPRLIATRLPLSSHKIKKAQFDHLWMNGDEAFGLFSFEPTGGLPVLGNVNGYGADELIVGYVGYFEPGKFTEPLTTEEGEQR